MKNYAILFAVSIVIIFVSSAEKNEILKNTLTKFWMSMENFESLIYASYTIPQCVNIFICDQSAGTEKLFKEFIKIYPFEYTINGTYNGCDSYFLVAESEESLLRDLIRIVTIDSNIEILIVIDNDVEETTIVYDFNDENITSLFDVWLYKNTNVNIAAWNGLWSLSDNFLYPRVLKKVLSYDEMVHKKGIVNLEGEELQATTYYKPPFTFLRSTVNRTIDGIEAEVFSSDDESELDGIEFLFFRLIADRLNFTYTIRKPSDQYYIGVKNGSAWIGGMIGQMVRKETHFAFGGLSLTQDVNDFANLTVPWETLHLQFLVPRPKPHASFWALTTPLSREFWAAIIAMLAVQSICVYIEAWVDSKIPKRFRSFTITWTELMARLLGTSSPRNIRGLKLQFQLWHFFGVLMVTAYSCSLAARLAKKVYDKRIDTAQDFVASNLTWGLEHAISDFSYYIDTTDPYTARIADTFVYESTPAKRQENILKKNYAIYGTRVGSGFFPIGPVNDADLKGYRLMKESVKDYLLTFAVTPWLVESVNQLILWMLETGLIQYHLNDVLYRRMSLALYEVMIENDCNNAEATVLELTPLGAGFALYFIGLFISTAAFYFELRSVGASRSIREVLQDIKKEREIRLRKERNRGDSQIFKRSNRSIIHY